MRKSIVVAPKLRGIAANLMAAFALVIALACALCPLSAFADDKPMSGTSGTCSWSIDADGKLVVEPTEGDVGELGEWNYNAGSPWCNRDDVKTAEFCGTVRAKTCAGMFRNCSNLQSILGLGNLDTSDTTNLSHMFDNCVSLAALDLSHLT